MKKNRGLVWETLIPWIVAIGVLILIGILYFILTERGQIAVEYFKNLLRFGR